MRCAPTAQSRADRALRHPDDLCDCRSRRHLAANDLSHWIRPRCSNRTRPGARRRAAAIARPGDLARAVTITVDWDDSRRKGGTPRRPSTRGRGSERSSDRSPSSRALAVASPCRVDGGAGAGPDRHRRRADDVPDQPADVYTASKSLGRVQETAQTAYDLMARDMREAAGNPCEATPRSQQRAESVGALVGQLGQRRAWLRCDDRLSRRCIRHSTGKRVSGTEAIELKTLAPTDSAHDRDGDDKSLTSSSTRRTGIAAGGHRLVPRLWPCGRCARSCAREYLPGDLPARSKLTHDRHGDARQHDGSAWRRPSTRSRVRFIAKYACDALVHRLQQPRRQIAVPDQPAEHDRVLPGR